MLKFNLDNFIPPTLQKKLMDTVVDFLSEQVKNYLGDRMAKAIEKLHSDDEFRRNLAKSLQKGITRFQEEYFEQDEDLVNTILAHENFFDNQELQESLLTILKNPGQYYKKEREVIFQTFLSVLPQRRNRERVDTAITFLLKCLAEEVWDLPELKPAYELQFSRMTTETLLEILAIQKMELNATVTLHEELKETLIHLTEAIVEKRLLPDMRHEPLVFHNLPRHDHTKFIGREAELQEIHRRLSHKDRHFIITIDGVGGIGKSSIALEASDYYLRSYYDLPEEERFNAIIWTSAKRTVLTGEGITNRVQSLRTLEDIYTTIAVTLDREDIVRSPVELQDDLVRHALARTRILLIVDNLETVDDERVMNFIREIPSPTKVIVTTRHRIDTALPIRLHNMSESESIQLIESEANSRSLVLTNEDKKSLAEHTGGIPLAIVWSISLLAYGYIFNDVLIRLKNPTNDLAKFCFDEVTRSIRSKPAYSLLRGISLFVTSCTRNMLGYVTGLTEGDRDDGLVELEKLSLVNRTGNEFSLLPLTRVYSQSELRSDKNFAETVIKQGTNYLVNLLKTHPDWYWIQDQVEILDQGENYRSLFEWSDTYHDFKSAANTIKPSVLFLDYTGRRGEASDLAVHGKTLLESHPDYQSVYAWLCVKNAWILSQNGQDNLHKQATSNINEAINIYDKMEDTKGQCFARCFYAQVVRHQGNYTDSLIILQDVKNRLERIDYPEGHIFFAYELGKLYREQKEWDSAYNSFKVAHEVLLSQNHILYPWFSLSKLAIHGNFASAAFEMQYYDEAQESVEQVLAELKRWKKFNLATNYWARMHLLAAKINLKVDKQTEAKSHALEAFRLGSSTKNEKILRSSELIIQSILA